MMETVCFSVVLILVFCLAFLYIKLKQKQSLFESKEKELLSLTQLLKEEKERFELATEATKDGLWDWNLITNELYFSRSWKSMLGYEENEIKADLSEWSKRVHPEDLQKALDDLDAHFSKKTDVYENIHRMKHKDGRWIWIYDRGKALFNKEGQAYRAVGFHTDISLQKEREKKTLKQEQKFFEQSKMASLGEMIGNIAHQWRQPLATISMISNNIMLDIDLEEASFEQIKTNAATIAEQTQYLSKTIDQFSDFIKEDKKVAKNSLENIVKEAVWIVGFSLKNNLIELKILIDEKVASKEFSGELLQVMINLLKNSKDILKEKNIKNPWIKIEVYKENEKAVISVEDNAEGITKEELSKVFEPYFTTKHKSQGTGLGLYLSYKIVTENLKGTMCVKNTKNGAKFLIELPLSNLKV